MEKNNKNNPFRVPEGYFDALENELALKTKFEAKKESTWVTPQNYFNTVVVEVEAQLTAKKPQQKQSIPLLEVAFTTAITALLTFYVQTAESTPMQDELLTAYGVELLDQQLYSIYDDVLEPGENPLTYEQLNLEELETIDPDYFPEFSYPLNYDEIEQ